MDKENIYIQMAMNLIENLKKIKSIMEMDIYIMKMEKYTMDIKKTKKKKEKVKLHIIIKILKDLKVSLEMIRLLKEKVL